MQRNNHHPIATKKKETETQNGPTVRQAISRICSPIMCLNERKNVRIDRKTINQLYEKTWRCHQLSCPFPINNNPKRKISLNITCYSWTHTHILAYTCARTHKPKYKPTVDLLIGKWDTWLKHLFLIINNIYWMKW